MTNEFMAAWSQVIVAGTVIGAVELVLVAGDRSTRGDHKALIGAGSW